MSSKTGLRERVRDAKLTVPPRRAGGAWVVVDEERQHLFDFLGRRRLPSLPRAERSTASQFIADCLAHFQPMGIHTRRPATDCETQCCDSTDLFNRGPPGISNKSTFRRNPSHWRRRPISRSPIAPITVGRSCHVENRSTRFPGNQKIRVQGSASQRVTTSVSSRREIRHGRQPTK